MNNTNYQGSRFHYRYSLFSTSGFSNAAQNFALAQQISLIDLRGAAFEPLRIAIDSCAKDILDLAGQHHVEPLPIGHIRTAFRLALGTWSETTDLEASLDNEDLAGEVNPATAEAELLPGRSLRAIATDFATDLQENLILGFPNASFILVLQPDDQFSFYRWIANEPSSIGVDIKFAERGNAAGDWVIVPHNAPKSALLRFGLPERLTTWLLAVDGSELERARIAKRQLLSTITIFVQDRAYSLRFQPSTRRRTQRRDESDAEYAEIQKERAAPDLAWSTTEHNRPHPTLAGVRTWSLKSARELIRRLEYEERAQATVLRVAAGNGGTIQRSQVYEVAGYPAGRTLNGFTKPVRRIVKQLQSEGLDTGDPEEALVPHYFSGSKAEMFSIDGELAAHLRSM